MSSDESDPLDDDSDDYAYDSGSSRTLDFTLRFEKSVGRVSGLGSEVGYHSYFSFS